MTKRLAWVALVCSLAAVVGACGQSRPTKATTTASPAAPDPHAVRYGPLGPAPVVDVTTSPSSVPFAKVAASPPVRKPPVCPGVVQGGGGGAQPTGSYISVAIDPYRAWTYKGSYCPELAPGNECWMPFQGSWRLLESAEGSIVFQAFENDASTPVRSPQLGPVPAAGSFNETTRFYYKPSKNAHSVTFRALLLDVKGQVVAQSDPQTLPIPGCHQV